MHIPALTAAINRASKGALSQHLLQLRTTATTACPLGVSSSSSIASSIAFHTSLAAFLSPFHDY
eukprot:4971534-Amphidinium_carterae.1